MAKAINLQVIELGFANIAAMANVVDHEVFVGVPICQYGGFGLVVTSICGG